MSVWTNPSERDRAAEQDPAAVNPVGEPGAVAGEPPPQAEGEREGENGQSDAGTREHLASLPASNLIEQLASFDGPPEIFLEFLLRAQCQITRAHAGAVLRTNDSGVVQVVAATPGCIVAGEPEPWLKKAGEVLGTRGPGLKGATILGVTQANSLYGAKPEHHVAILPLRRPGGLRGAAAYLFADQEVPEIIAAQQQLELTLSLLGQYELRLTLQRRLADLRLATGSMEAVSNIQQYERFKKAAMALTNEIAARWKATRVSLGLLPTAGARNLKLVATSHAEQFSRKMRLVQDLESAMEECLDQGIEVMLPCPPDAPIINRQHQNLSQRHGPCHAVSLPLRRLGEVEGVLTVEFDPQRTLTAPELETLRILCDMAAPYIFEVHRRDRFVGLKLVEGARQFASGVVGPRYTWAKLLAAGLAGFLAFALLYPAPYRVEAPFSVESSRRHILTAPFDGYLADVLVSVGDELEEGAVLAEMHTEELRMELASARAELAKHLKEADVARREGKTADAQVSESEADRVAAHIDLLEYRISLATLKSPVAGVVAEGDLKKQIGSAVSRGDTLFEITRLADLEAELAVPESRIGDVNDLLARVKEGEAVRGTLAAASHPGRYLGFTVLRVEPVAEVVENRNIFKVKAAFDSTPQWLRPGVEGLAKIDAGHASYLWIWTRDAVNWVRMKLWI